MTLRHNAPRQSGTVTQVFNVSPGPSVTLEDVHVGAPSVRAPVLDPQRQTLALVPQQRDPSCRPPASGPLRRAPSVRPPASGPQRRAPSVGPPASGPQRSAPFTSRLAAALGRGPGTPCDMAPLPVAPRPPVDPRPASHRGGG
ncbi:unnamed protein product [Arctogadus glacialis]